METSYDSFYLFLLLFVLSSTSLFIVLNFGFETTMKRIRKIQEQKKEEA
jgi:hypothetical protein